MTSEIFEKDVLFYQRLLKSLGLYVEELDGDWGPNTEKADRLFAAETAAISSELGSFDSRTERNIATLHPKAQRAARMMFRMLDDAKYPLTVKIVSGTRSYLEQDALYAQGRFGNPGPKVTNARGGQSNHNFAIAWDIAIFRGREYLDGDEPAEIAEYEKIAAIVRMDDVQWGGDWEQFKDRPHYQLATGRSSSEIRTLFEAGKSYI